MKSTLLPKGSAPEKHPTVYLNDGYGRDTYISYNNGGNYSQELRFLVSPKGQTSLRSRQNQLMQSGNFTPRIFYQSDGSGRDTYVYQNIQDKFSSGQVDYKKLLRSESHNINQGKYRYQLPPLAIQKQQKIFQLQQVQSSRLAMPRHNFIEQ